MAMRVAIVGAGIHGLSAAWHCSQRGHHTTLFERFELGHAFGSSHGKSRIVRRAYTDALYTGIMLEGYGLWKDLESATGRLLLHEVGLLYFGHRDSNSLLSVEAGLREHRIAHEVLHPNRISNCFPRLLLSPDEVGIWTPEAGWVDAEGALRALADAFVLQGGVFVWNSAVNPFDLLTEFDAVLVCVGAWARTWFDLPVQVKLMTFAYLPVEVAGPVWIEDGPNLLYGFPSDVTGAKVGVHQPGIGIDPDNLDRSPGREEIDLISDFGRRRLGIDIRPVEATGCLYTSTATSDFLWGRFAENGFYVSACSGHGFKFGPWIGKMLGSFCEGGSAPSDYPRFHLDCL